MDTYEILVVLLSVSLIVVLIVTTIALVLLIRILQQVQKLTHRAELMVDKVESVGEFFKNTAGISSIVKIVGGLVDTAKKHSKKEDKE
jgi:Na+-transporting NADH:ubiquinone oxidoreductase subunit NqrC